MSQMRVDEAESGEIVDMFISFPNVPTRLGRLGAVSHLYRALWSPTWAMGIDFKLILGSCGEKWQGDVIEASNMSVCCPKVA
jgi:hypothetical protein